ncbi:uncharacterized protein LOC133722515 [Rosa rugosa]|uniref:uncharacterized protein LOC133722515 n=1 Tax=Rosa rugosa TaxID=74645 RepID=UPI002B40637B|nr:uncharacterized protein LOC133722515 [Rosa rugosa]
MEKKRKKDEKVACTTSQEPETDHHILSKDHQSQVDTEPLTKSTNTDSPSNGNVPSLCHQYPVTFPWPYTPQHGGEQCPLVSRPFVATQSPLPGIISQWPQFPHQVQHGQPPQNYSQSAAPFWLPQQPGYPFSASNAPPTCQPFVAVGATDISGGTSTTNQTQVPNFYYHVGYPYPGFPGSCDSLSWWNQAQAPQPLCTYAFPGGCISSPPASLPSCSATLGQTFEKGIIRPPAKLSKKHQQLWDVQSAENVQLWSAINHLQSEATDYKNCLTRLEAELSSLKAGAEETTAQVSGAVLSAKPSKRGRPKRSVASADAVHSPDKSHRRARGRKSVVCNAQQFDSKSHLFEKVILNKVEDKEKACHLTAAVEQGNNASHVVTHSGGNMEINGTSSTMPAFHYQFQHELPAVQTRGNGSSASLEMKGTDVKANNCRTTYPIYPQNIPWPYNNTSEMERNELNIGPNGLYNSGIVITQGGQIIPGWSFGNEEDASEKQEDAMLGSGKNDNEETMGDESSSGAEKVARTNNEGGFKMDDREGTSNKCLAPPNN